MNPIARQKLIELVERFGGGVCDDPRRCEALLRDLCGDQHQREVFVLVAAVRNREAAELAAVGGGVPKEVLLARLSARLHRNCGFTEDLARWSVESWALALDKITTINKTIETLLQLAHEHGHLTCDDVNNNLPDGLTPEDRDHLYEKLRSLNIKIVDFAQEAAEQGHTHAQHNLAARYARESHLAASIAEKSLAASYANGEGVEADKEKAVKWYRKAAEQGHADAQYNLALCYDKGEGVEVDWEEAVEWYRKAAEQGHAGAQYDLSIRYDDWVGVEKDREESVKWCRKAAEQGYAPAQYTLAFSYANGEGVEVDEEEAVRWYRKAAEQGHADAQESLAASYANGEGVEADKEEAVRWYRKAAEQGRVHAQCHLAASYANGEGVGKNKEEAVKWYRKAAKQGHAVFCPWCSQVESLEAGGDR